MLLFLERKVVLLERNKILRKKYCCGIPNKTLREKNGHWIKRQCFHLYMENQFSHFLQERQGFHFLIEWQCFHFWGKNIASTSRLLIWQCIHIKGNLLKCSTGVYESAFSWKKSLQVEVENVRELLIRKRFPSKRKLYKQYFYLEGDFFTTRSYVYDSSSILEEHFHFKKILFIWAS